jgi:bifunctional non-homologous end joining protein LigD
MATRRIEVEVDGRRLSLTNLDKVLYPGSGFTKRDVIDYYRRIAPVLLPYMADRPATFLRYPDGVAHKGFYEKDVSRHAPDWVRTAELVTHSRGSDGAVNHHPVVDSLPTLVWAANLAAIELHVPQWTVGPRGARRDPDLLVFDLDPGEPATVVECAEVAVLLREALAEDGLTAYAKTSGSKGMQLYCAVRTRRPEATSEYAKALAERLTGLRPELVIARMDKASRPGKVFVDWSQNNPAKTTIAPYSLRGRDLPTVSTPITWDEVEACRTTADLTFTTDDVLDRVDELGDLLAGLPDDRSALPRG